MTTHAVAQCVLYVLALVALAIPLGHYIARVYGDQPTWSQRLVGPIERVLYRICGVRVEQEMDYKRYAGAVLIFNLLGIALVYAIQRFQAHLPYNPLKLGAVPPPLAFNTAVSFATNTNWQAYGGETTMSYFTQMVALSVQNFVSAATGIAVLIALIRGIMRRSAQEIGNFWVDLTKSVLYILLPLSLVFALVLVSQGVVQTVRSAITVPLLDTIVVDGKKIIEQVVALGPAASQIAIKQLGTNGGGFFNVNAAHPFENPTALSNLLQMLAILLIPAALCFTFGKLVNDRRQGYAVFAAMLIIFVPLMLGTIAAEQAGNPIFDAVAVDQQSSALSPGGNMEGKEARFGVTNSAIWAVATTAASNGSVNAMHDSFMPLGGMIPMWLMQLGEIVFGGVGSGLYGMLIYVIITIFIAGLMVGRTPEYLGKKIEAFEMKMATLVVLIPAAAVLIGTAIASVTTAGTGPLGNPGAHGFSEMLYAFSSAANNNGSAFGGLTASGMFYSVALGICMLIGRYAVIVPILAIAGSLAQKKYIPTNAGTLKTHTPLFIVLLVGVIVLIGALTFIPSLALGPIVEQIKLLLGR